MKHSIMILLALACGCIAQTQYVCPDGVTVPEAGMCQSSTTQAPIVVDQQCMRFKAADGSQDLGSTIRCQLKRTPQMRVCDNLGDSEVFSRGDCIVELASITRDSGLCSQLTPNMEILCTAYATSDISLCAEIGVEETRQWCEYMTAPTASAEGGCIQSDPEERTWCIVYSAKEPADCLRIDDTRFGDESVFCRALASKDASRCDGIGDPILSGLCAKTASEI